MISRLTESFSDNHNFDLFHIGSKNINKFTFKQITLNRIFKKKTSRINIKTLKESVHKDNKIISFKNSSFYCLVVLSNLENKNFLKK
tara:strand:- start:508 stop:768 length:261 start_codon:yes stop_codon:yes gene_type:complete